jgi:cytidylate kinase
VSKPTPKDIQRLLDEQVHSWARLKSVRIDPRPLPWPVVTVSREFGSLGAETAGVVASRLGFRLWGKELVDAIAEETGLQRTLLESLDERARSLVEDFVAETLVGKGGSAADYVAHVGRVVRALSRHGSAVVVGRGAQFVVDPTHALRVRVVCPLRSRIAGFAARSGLDEKEAERRVLKGERERIAYLRRYHEREPGDPSHYDLVVSTGGMDQEAAADIVLAAYRAKFGRLPEGLSLVGYQR